MVTFDLEHFKVNSGVIRCVCFRMAWHSKTSVYRATCVEFWTEDTSDLVVFKVILGSIGALVSKWTITKEREKKKTRLATE